MQTVIAVLVGQGGELDRATVDVQTDAQGNFTLHGLSRALSRTMAHAWILGDGDVIRIRTPENIDVEV